jgi:hypothetical protein
MNMSLAGMRCNLEQSRKAAWEREKEARDREHELERVMREQSRKIDQIQLELTHAQDTMEVGQTTSAIYRDIMEVKQRRLEAAEALQRDEIYSLRLALQEAQAQAQAQEPVQAPEVPENHEPVLDVAPEIDLFAHENLDGFDMEVEDNMGGFPLAPNQFAWANANADGFDPEGHGPLNEEEEDSDEEEEEDPSEVEGNSGIDEAPASILSSSIAASQQNFIEEIEDNEVDQPLPPLGIVPPGRTLMTVNQDVLQAAMARLGISTVELGIYPYGG